MAARCERCLIVIGFCVFRHGLFGLEEAGLIPGCERSSVAGRRNRWTNQVTRGGGDAAGCPKRNTERSKIQDTLLAAIRSPLPSTSPEYICVNDLLSTQKPPIHFLVTVLSRFVSSLGVA